MAVSHTVFVRWSPVCLRGSVSLSAFAVIVTRALHFHTLSMLANTQQRSLLSCSSHSSLHIAVSPLIMMIMMMFYYLCATMVERAVMSAMADNIIATCL